MHNLGRTGGYTVSIHSTRTMDIRGLMFVGVGMLGDMVETKTRETYLLYRRASPAHFEYCTARLYDRHQYQRGYTGYHHVQLYVGHLGI